jgi:hypothetical protein|tara:strand:- start:3490 stop:3624 length:135 start_codon:yes stop_codon:yes gene_type:complete
MCILKQKEFQFSLKTQNPQNKNKIHKIKTKSVKPGKKIEMKTRA